MTRFLRVLAKWFVTRDEGASLVEYSLALLLIVVVTIATISLLGNSLSTLFTIAASSI
jgi:Flp pilus assembly pilin Flp